MFSQNNPILTLEKTKPRFSYLMILNEDQSTHVRHYPIGTEHLPLSQPSEQPPLYGYPSPERHPPHHPYSEDNHPWYSMLRHACIPPIPPRRQRITTRHHRSKHHQQHTQCSVLP